MSTVDISLTLLLSILSINELILSKVFSVFSELTKDELLIETISFIILFNALKSAPEFPELWKLLTFGTIFIAIWVLDSIFFTSLAISSLLSPIEFTIKSLPKSAIWKADFIASVYNWDTFLAEFIAVPSSNNGIETISSKLCFIDIISEPNFSNSAVLPNCLFIFSIDDSISLIKFKTLGNESVIFLIDFSCASIPCSVLILNSSIIKLVCWILSWSCS